MSNSECKFRKRFLVLDGLKILQNNFCLIALNRNKDNHNLLPLHSFASNSITRDPTGGVIVSGHLKTAGGS